MPSNAAGQNSAGSNSGSNASAPTGKSDYAMIKDAGFRNKNEFMLSYGLRMKNQDDYEEAKAILDGMRKIDEQQAKGADK